MQTAKVNGYITEKGKLIIDANLPLPPGNVEVIVLRSDSEKNEKEPYTPEQEATIQRFLKAAGAIKSGDPNSSIKVDEVLYGGKQ